MPVLADSFRRIRLIDQTTPAGPIDLEIVADDRNDTLNLQAGIGISLIVDPVTDSIIIYNTGSPVGIANLDDILQVGNTSSIGIDVGSVKVDETTINNNTISTTLSNNLTLTPGPSGGLLVVDSVTAIRIPLGAENQRPAVGTNPGYIRFNLDKMRFEGFNGSAWSSLGGVTSDDGGTTIEPGVDGGSPLLIFKASNEIVATFSAYNNKFFSKGFQIPTGDTTERPDPPQEGMIRYNTTTDQFEGYNGIGWSSLGGVRDIDGNTYIIPESIPGANDNTLYFVTNGDTALTLDGTKLTIKGERSLRFEEPVASGSNYIDIKTPPEVTATYTLKLPRQIGSNGDILSLNNLGELEFTPADSFAGGRVIVSADFGDDINDGINKPVKTIKRALQIASGFVYDANKKVNGKKIVINVASGDYVEDNPIIIPDNVSVLGAGLRACNVRPANANKDFLRVRNGCYFGEFTFRDFVDANQIPVHTFDYAVAFDDPTDAETTRVGYTNLPTTKPVISVSPYIQNVSILSFLGGNGVIVDGNLVQTPNSPSIQAIVENPVEGPAPEQGKSMVANAFTMLSFGGTGWRIINDAYAQIVSCFQIFMLNGSYCQSGGYLSITNSATNFGLYALRASGYSRNAFQFDKGYIALTGTSETQQTITALGFGRLPTQDFVIRFRSPNYRIAYDLLLASKASIQTNTINWITDQITNNTPPFTNTFTYNQVKCSRDIGLIVEAVAFDVLTGGNAKSVEAGLSYFNAQSAVLNSQKAQNIAAFNYAKSLAQTAVTVTGLSNYVGDKFDVVIDTIDDPTTAPEAVAFSNDGDITSSFKPSAIEKSFNAAQVDVLLDTITVTAHGFTNGDGIIYDSNGNTDISGLDNEQTYYVTRLDDNTIELYFDDSRTIKVNILAVGTGTHKFIKNLQEFYIDEIKESHNSYQELTLASGTYSFTPGRQITGVTGSGVNSAYVHSYDPIGRKLIVSLNQVTIGVSVIRNPFLAGSTVDNDHSSPIVNNISVTSIAPISSLYTATFSILSTTANGELTNLSNLPYNQIWLHRPSIVNSSSHTWEYAGSGTDYNALPQNGGQTIEDYEQYADLPGRVYTSGTNELGDFKVGDFIKAENKTGNVSFTNKVSVAELDALRLAIGDIVIEFISNDIGLGDNEPGGSSDSRLSTQKAIRSFLANRLGGFIDKAVSTNAVPGAVVQLNSSGQINPDLLPAVRAFNSAKGEGFNSRQYLVEEVPAYDFLNGDIVTEEYATVQLTLNRAVTAALGDLVVQANSNARGLVISDVNSDTVITVASEGLTFTNNFNTVDTLTIDGDATPSDSNQSVTPTIVGTIANNVNGNHVLSNANESQYLVLSPSLNYSFTIGNFITSANDNIQGEITSTRYGVISTVDNAALIGGSGYSPASGTFVYKFVTLTGGSGTGAKADITVTNGSVTSVDMRRGGTGFVTEELLSAAAADLGGGSPTAFSVKVTGIEKRVYVSLTGGERFVATLASPNYIADNNAPVKTVDLTGTSQKSFNAQDISLGGAVDYANSRITLNAHGYANGDPVKYVSTPNTAIGNLANNNVYYVKVYDANSIELHETYNVNSKITFSSSSSGTHSLIISNLNTINSTIYSAAHGFSTGDALRLTGALGAALPLVSAVRIISGTFFFVGSRTDNSFTIHANRSEALASVNGLTISKIVFDSNQTGTTGNALFTKQNVSVIRTVNTSSTNLENWGSLSANTLDASSIVSGTISTTRLASQGSANDKTFLRGDSKWSVAVQTVKEIDSPLTISGDFTTVTVGVVPNQTTENRYYGDIQLDIDRVDGNLGDTLYSNLGVAKFSKTQFNVGTGTAVGQIFVKDGVIDAGLLDGKDGAWYSDPNNLSSNVPATKGGTGLSSYAVGDLIYAQATNSLTRLGISTTAGALLTSSGSVPQWSTNLSVPGTLAVTNTTDSTSSTTGAFTVAGGAGIAKTLSVGDNLNVGKDLIVSGNLNVKGTTTSINSTIATVLDKNLELGVVVLEALSNIKGTLSTDGLNYTLSSLTKDGVAIDATTLIGPYVTPSYKPQIRKVSGAGSFGVGTVILSVPNATSIVIEPTPTITNGEVTFNILTPTDSTANEGGITLLGDTNKSFNWINATDSWTSSENIELAANKSFRIDGVDVLSKTALGSSVTTSSLTQFGTITVGVWQATVIRPEYGGTGVNNGNKKLTLAGETDQTLTSVIVAAGTSGQFTCASATLAVNDRIVISGTNVGNGSITGYTNPKTYKISVTNGTTTFTLVNLDGTAIVTSRGTPPNDNGTLTGLTFTRKFEHSLTVTMTGDSSVSVPTSGTLSTLTGTETLENKTLVTPKVRDSNGDNTYNITVGNLAANRNIALPVLTNDDTFVFAAHTQTLSNKTLTLPKINDTSSDHTYNFAVNELAANRTITLPLLTSDDTFVFQAHTQTMSNKTLTLPKINDASDTHTYNIGVSELTANRIISLPLLENNDTFVFQNFAQTLANKNLVDDNTYFIDNITSGLRFNFQTSSIGVGSGLQLTVTTNGTGQISSVSTTIPNGGSNFRTGDIVTISGPGTPSALATYTISGVNASGSVTSGSLTTAGAGYTASQTAASTTSLTGATRTFTVPSFSTTLVGTDVSQTLTNKSFNDDSTEFFDNTDTTKKFKFQASEIATGTTRTLTIPNKDGIIATTDDFSTLGGNGQLTLGVNGNGLTGSATFTANQTGDTTFTVTSNATTDNTENTIVYRGTDGNFSAGTITATAFDGKLTKTVTGTSSAELIRATMGTNDFFRIQVGSVTEADNGFVEIATADNGTEPIYVRQYTGDFETVLNTATILGADGNTSFPGTVTATSFDGKISLIDSPILGSEAYLTFVETNSGSQNLRTDGGLRYQASLNKIFLGAIESSEAVGGLNLSIKNAEDVNEDAGTLYFYGGRGKGTGRGSSVYFYGGNGSTNESSVGQGGGIYFSAGQGSRNSNPSNVILGAGGVGGPIQLNAGNADNRGLGARLLLIGGKPDTTKPNDTLLEAASARLLENMPGGDLLLIAGGSTGTAQGGEIRLFTSAAGATGSTQNSLTERLTVKSTGQISLSTNITSTSTSTGTLVVTGGVGISENLNVGGNVVITGGLTVNGTTTTINSTTILVDDKNIELGSVDSPTDDTADGGGITLKGAADKTFNWIKSTLAWTSSENLELAAGKKLVIGGVTSGKITLAAAAEAGTNTITLPAATGTVALLSSLSVTTEAASGSGSLAYNNSTGAFTYTPPAQVSFTDTNTTYSIALSDGDATGEVDIDLTAGGSGSGTDSVTLKAGSNITLTRSNDIVTIANSYSFTESDTLATVTGRASGNTTATAISLTNSTASTSTTTGALVVTGGVGIGGSIYTGGTEFRSSQITFGLLDQTTKTINIGNQANAVNIGQLQTYNIATVSRSSNIATITTSVPHGLSSGDRIWVTCSTNNSYNASSVVLTSGTTGSTLVYANTGTDQGVTAAAGTVDFYGTTNVRQNLTVSGAVKVNGATLGLTNGGQDFSIFVNSSGQMQFIANAAPYGSGTIVMTLDDDGGTSTLGTGQISISSTTASTSTGTGSLIVAGGVGIAGALYANSLTSGSGSNLQITSGVTSSTNSNGMTLALSSGNSGSNSGNGGQITITTGNAVGALGGGSGGDLSIATGTGGGRGGNITITTGNGAASANSGSISITTGTGGTGQAGGSISISPGAAVGTNITGANLSFNAGNGTGTGGSGQIIFRVSKADITSSTATNTVFDAVTIANTGAISISNSATILKDATNAYLDIYKTINDTVIIEAKSNTSSTTSTNLLIRNRQSGTITFGHDYNTASYVDFQIAPLNGTPTYYPVVSSGPNTGDLDNDGATYTVSGTNTNLRLASKGTGRIYIDNPMVVETIIERLETKTGATGVIDHNLSTTAIWYHSSVAANFTINFTNAPTTNDRIITASVIINQGATAYIPNAVQIAGVAQTLNWADNTVPTGVANRTQIFGFSLIRTGSAWVVLGSAQAY